MTERTRPAADDSGLTLVELAVAGAILALVLVAIGAVLVGTLNAQRTVAAVTQTASSAQAAVSAITDGIRNSSDLHLANPSGSDQLLVTRTAGVGASLTWSCHAWYYSASAGTIRTTTTTDGTRITAPTGPQLETWTVAVTGVSPVTGTAIFSTASGGIRIAFRAEVSDGQPVLIQTTAITRTGVAGAGTCF